MNYSIEPAKKAIFPFSLKLKTTNIITEEEEIKKELIKIKKDIDLAYHRFENTTEKELIDSCIYEMKALQTKYEYYFKKAKEYNNTNIKELKESS